MEPETQPGAGRTGLDLLWRQPSSERRQMPGFVNVGQCSHTPTEMALFSKIQPAPTALLGAQQSRVYRGINPGVITAGLTWTLQGAPSPFPARPSTLLKLLGGVVFFRGDNTLGEKNNLFLGWKMLLSACWVLGIAEQIVTPTRDLARLVRTFLLTSIPGAFQNRDGAGAPTGPSLPGSSSRVAREGVEGSSLLGNSVVKRRRVIFPWSFVGERQRGRLSRSSCRMLPMTDAAGDVLAPSPRRSALRRGRGRLGPGCPWLALAKFRLLLLNERGMRQERNPNGRRRRGGGGEGLSSGFRQQKAGRPPAIVLLCRDGIHPAQARREGADHRGTGSRYREAGG